ncbi:unnamed protein product [Amoebophrya sp. A120]|nr:unnamed protein product [Amoebophrya sp. A120]|eukprot:GSA120T00015962001.1
MERSPKRTRLAIEDVQSTDLGTDILALQDKAKVLEIRIKYYEETAIPELQRKIDDLKVKITQPPEPTSRGLFGGLSSFVSADSPSSPSQVHYKYDDLTSRETINRLESLERGKEGFQEYNRYKTFALQFLSMDELRKCA